MPNIKTFEAGTETFHPSDAGAAAFREAGGVASHMANATAEQFRQLGREVGGAVAGFGNIIETHQAHTDAMAEIDFQHQLTDAEIAAQGGVNMAGTPKAADGTPITDNPGRGVNKSLPPDASVPSPGQFATAASDVTDDHNDFLDNLIGRLTGTGVSQKARDRMALQAAESQRRIAIHANAVAGEVAFNHATHTTEQTVNSTFGALSRGDMSLPDAMQHIDGTFDAFQGALSGDFAAKGGKIIEDKRAQAHQQAIWTAASTEVANGHIDKARAIINDPRWDADIGGPQRQDMLNNLTKVEQQRIKDQNAADAAAEKQAKTQQDDITYKVYQNSLLPPDKQDPNLTRARMATMQPFVGRASDLQKAQKTLDELNKQTADPLVSTKIEQRLSSGITDGSITTEAQIDQAFKPGEANSLTWDARNRLKSELKDTLNSPAIKQFNSDINNWVKQNQGQIDRTYGAAPGAGATKSELGQEMISKWEADVKRKAQIMRSQGKDPNDLLNPNSPDSMVTPQALSPYRVTKQMETQYQANQKAGDAAVNAAHGVDNGGFFGGAPAVTVPQGMTPDQVIKQYPPGTKLILPDGRTKYVPGFQKMNFAPEDQGIGGTPAQKAINGAMNHAMLQPTPGHNPDLQDVDHRLVDVVATGAQSLPDGYRVTVNEGYNAQGHVSGSQHHIKGRGALDVQIWAPNGKKISNRGDDPTGMYHKLADAAYQAMQRKYPELDGKFAWGGNFGTVSGGSVPDLMHFDLGGVRGRLDTWPRVLTKAQL